MIIYLQVTEATQQVGRVSFSTPFDKPYTEMALHCEAVMGKQQVMATFMIPHPAQGNPFTISAQDYQQGMEEEPSNSDAPQSLPMVLLPSFLHLHFEI